MPSKPAGRSRKSPGRSRKAAAPARRASAKTARPAARSRPRAVVVARPARSHKSAVRPAPKARRPAPKERPLTRREVGEFQRILEAERDRLTEELEAIEEHQPEVENVGVDAAGGYDEDLVDVASETFEREKGIAIENSVSNLLQQVEEALGRIENGTYGVCEICDQPIHPDRLRAIPYARLCINCKEREEQAIPR
jgi:RNA polymerase-binding protein DksA